MADATPASVQTSAQHPAAPAVAPSENMQFLEAAARRAAASTEGPRNFSWIPDKHRVPDAWGSVDLEASFKRTAERYDGLVRRMGDVGLRPEAANGYQFEGLPEGMTMEKLKAEPGFQAMLEEFHQQGLTTAQAQWAWQRGQGLVPQLAEVEIESCREQLREVWKDEKTFDVNMRLAHRAAATLLGQLGIDFGEFDRQYGNQPHIVRLLARIGREMAEDTSVSAGALNMPARTFDVEIEAINAQLQALPQHERTQRLELNQRKVALFEKQYGRGGIVHVRY